MTPLQAEMLITSLSLVASVIAVESLEGPNDDPHKFQDRVARQCRKAFRSHLTSYKIITPEPKKSPKPKLQS